MKKRGFKRNCLVSAVVTNFNGWELGLLNDFFSSFLKDNYKNFEIFLVDMSSWDRSVENVKKKFGKDKRLKVIVNPVNNMSKGINMALEKARGKYVLFLNNDIYLQKGAIKKMVDFMEEHTDVAQVQGKIVSYFDHKRIDSVGETMDIYGNPVTLGAGEKDKRQHERETEVLSVTGASALLRRELIKKVGFLDPSYAIGYEDMDLSLRLRIAGYKMYYLPSVLVFHRRASSTSRVSEKLRSEIKFWFNKNRLVTIIKNYEFVNILKSLPVIIFIYIFAGLFEIIYKKLWRFGLSRLRAMFWVMLNLPELLRQRKKIQNFRKLKDAESIVPFMQKRRLVVGFKSFLGSKRW